MNIRTRSSGGNFFPYFLYLQHSNRLSLLENMLFQQFFLDVSSPLCLQSKSTNKPLNTTYIENSVNSYVFQLHK